MNENFNPKIEIKKDPIQEIMALRQQIQQEGNVDSELNFIDNVLSQIKEVKITPEIGLSQVQNLIERRQNYH